MHRDTSPPFLNLEESQLANCHLLACLTYKRAMEETVEKGSDFLMTAGGALTRLKDRYILRAVGKE